MKIIFLIIFIYLNLYSDSHRYKVTYILKLNPAVTSGQRINPDLLNSVNNVKRLYVLESDGGRSLYRFDTIIYQGTKPFSQSALMDLAYFKDFNSSELIVFDKLPKKSSGTKSTLLKSSDWHIYNETLTIGKYKTKKAVLKSPGKNIIAWFTEQLEIKDGPELYSGLPGLIIKLDMGDVSIEFYKIEKLSSGRKIDYPILANLLSYSEFENYKKNKMAGVSR